MNWEFFLINGIRFSNPREIFEALKMTMGTDMKWSAKMKGNYVEFCAEKCIGSNAFRRNLFYVETNMPKSNIYNTVGTQFPFSVFDDFPIFESVGINVFSLAIFSNGVICVLHEDSSCISNLSQNHPLEECVMVVSKYSQIHPSVYKDIFSGKDYRRLVEGVEIPARENPSSEGEGMYFRQLSPHIEYYTSHWNDVAVKLGFGH